MCTLPWTTLPAIGVSVTLMALGANARELPKGLIDHGIAAPVGMSAWGGTVATATGEGQPLVFIKLWAGGGSSYLFIDGVTGKTEQIAPGIRGLGAYLVFLSPANKVYDTMGEWFLEIDVPTREIRRVGKIPSGMALSFTMDDEGVVYAGIYPSATLVTFNPATGEYRNHGPMHEADWPQYPRPLALDDHGWVYSGIAIKAAQVVGFHPATGERRAYVPEAERTNGAGRVFRGTNGKVYATAPKWGWIELSNGEATPVEKPPVGAVPRPTDRFPDGGRLVNVDVHNRRMSILDAGADTPREVSFDYDSPGVNIYSMVSGPDGCIHGATGLPLRIWRFDPRSGAMNDWGLGNHGGHANQFVRQGDTLYGAVYSSGSLIEYDPTQPVDDAPIRSSANPRHVHGYRYGFGGDPDMYGRPHAMIAHPDGKHVVLGGNPARAHVGGGLLFYNAETGEEAVLTPDRLVPDQGVNALAALPGGDLIVGTTTAAATGGRATATAAMLCRLDWKTREVIGRWTLQPATTAVRDLVTADDGLVYGLAAGNRLFAFDPATGKVVHDEVVDAYGVLTGSQAPRTMALGPDGGIYVLFRDAIARIQPGTFTHREIVRPGMTITAGIVIHDNRLYFAAGTRLCSFELESAE